MSNKKYKCNISFYTHISYIVQNKDDKITDSTDIIKIDDYLKNNILQEEIKNGKKFLVCKNNHELIKYKSEIRKSHFRHKNSDDTGGQPMTEWHANWQSYFKNTEVNFPRLLNGIKNRRADVVIGDYVLEFQHSMISKNEVENRCKDYMLHNKKIYWIINCNGSVKIEFLELNGTFLIEFKDDIWKYENFINQDYIYLNIEDRIYKVDPKKIKSRMIDVREYKLKKDFIESFEKNINIWNDTELTQCRMYYNQRGAGSGKTYESIQLLGNDKRFLNKTIFIYLTKMHSAKDVIYNELNEQYNKGNLSKLDIPEIGGDEINGKQYKIKYINRITNKECTIIIGTIDSFMYNIGNKNHGEKDFFGGIVKSIREGYVNTTNDGSIKYAGENTKLNKNCLIIIDEAQDLDEDYIFSISKIMRNTYIDAYIIGDKLQSVMKEYNVITILEKNDLPNTEMIRNKGINQIRRFHKSTSKHLVNNIVHFKKFGLPEIESICDGNCNYKHDNNISYKIFEIPKIYAYDYNYKKINEIIEKLINFMEKEQIDKYNYTPDNFTFIFPILSGNYFANMLESRLQKFWIRKFEDQEYQNCVLKNHRYWKDCYNDKLFNEYVYLHKSNEGKSINLKESENSTRIMSIHAAKGTGREVIFLLGLTEEALNILSKKIEIVYESLLHTSITRHKMFIYIGLENNDDDIWKRFKKNSYIEKNENIEPDLTKIKKSNKFSKIIEFSEVNFNKIDTYFDLKQYQKILPKNNKNNNIIDMEHHLIRFNTFFYYIMLNILNDIDDNNINDVTRRTDQFKTILNKISKLEIKFYNYKDYYKKIWKLNKDTNENEIPILYYDSINEYSKYYKYRDILVNFIQNIQYKMKNLFNRNKKLPNLCPLEAVILFHIVEIMKNGKYADITINAVYRIIKFYDESSNKIDNNHNMFECPCYKIFKKKKYNDELIYDDNIEKFYHYEKIKPISNLYENYKKYIDKEYGNSKNFAYNIYHNINFDGQNENFKLWDRYYLVAYSEKYVIFFIIKPQFNKLNINDVLLNAIFANYMIINTKKDTNNYERYNNKKIIICILTLDSEEPIFLDFNIDKNNDLLKQTIKDYLFNKYSEYHEDIINFYNYHKSKKPKNKNSIDYIYNILSDEEYEKLPKYIINYFYDIKKEINTKNKNEKQNILLSVNNRDIFLSELNKYLKNFINEFMDINDNDSDCDF